MQLEKAKKTVRMRPITLLVYFVCLIALSVSATYLIWHAKAHNKDQEILAAQKNNKSLSDKNIALQGTIEKLINEYANLESQFKDLASRLDTAEQTNTQTALQLASALKDLETSKADTLKFKGELDAKLSEIEAMSADRQALETKYNSLKQMLAPHLILEPAWVGSGETASAFNGHLSIVLYEASDTSKCREDSEAVCYITEGKDKKELCLRTGKPESFKYQGKKYLFNLLQSNKNSEGAHHYCISILKER